MDANHRYDYSFNPGTPNNPCNTSNGLFSNNNPTQNWQSVNNYLYTESNTFHMPQWKPNINIAPALQQHQPQFNKTLFDETLQYQYNLLNAKKNPDIVPKPSNYIPSINALTPKSNGAFNINQIPLPKLSTPDNSPYEHIFEELDEKIKHLRSYENNNTAMDNTAFTNNDAAAEPFELPDTSKISKAIEWINMAWRAIRGEQSAEIIAWQQNNRVANARLAAVSDGIVNSQVQKSVNAFSEGLINTVQAPVQFIGAEIDRLVASEQTQTSAFLNQVFELIGEEASRVYLGEQTQVGQFFDNLGNLISEDFDRLNAGTETVIGTAILNDFKSFLQMPPEQMAHCLGEEIGGAFLLWGAGNGIKFTGQGFKSLYAAVTKYIHKPKELNKSLTFMYGADSYQAQKLRKDFIKQDPAFALQYLSEIKQKSHILSQFQPQTQILLQSEEFWNLTGRGERFEKWLQSELGASGNFKAGGKEFDGKVGNIWLEAKSGNFWNNLTPGSNELKTFKAKIGHAKSIAEANGGILQIHSDVTLPEHIIKYLNQNDIEYKIHTIFLEVEPCPKVLL